MITLYDYILSGNCYKVRLMASLLDIELETEAVDFHPGKAHKSAWFRAINPLGELPVIRDGELIIRDANAILVHLASNYSDGEAWYPRSQGGAIQQWLALAESITRTAGAARLHDMLGYSLDVDAARAGARRAFRVLDDHLSEGEIKNTPWLVGSHVTIADVACFPYTALAEDGGICLDDYGAIRHWIGRMKRLPKFITMPGIGPAF